MLYFYTITMFWVRLGVYAMYVAFGSFVPKEEMHQIQQSNDAMLTKHCLLSIMCPKY